MRGGRRPPKRVASSPLPTGGCPATGCPALEAPKSAKSSTGYLQHHARGYPVTGCLIPASHRMLPCDRLPGPASGRVGPISGRRAPGRGRTGGGGGRGKGPPNGGQVGSVGGQTGARRPLLGRSSFPSLAAAAWAARGGGAPRQGPPDPRRASGRPPAGRAGPPFGGPSAAERPGAAGPRLGLRQADAFARRGYIYTIYSIYIPPYIWYIYTIYSIYIPPSGHYMYPRLASGRPMLKELPN